MSLNDSKEEKNKDEKKREILTSIKSSIDEI